MAKTTDKETDTAQAEEKPSAEIITVKSALKSKRDGGAPVALWEQHADHPKANPNDIYGEVYVAGDKPVKVAKTPLVRKKLNEGALVEV